MFLLFRAPNSTISLRPTLFNRRLRMPTYKTRQAVEAQKTAVMTHGGMGYAAEYDVERYLRECLIPRIAPVSPQLILSYIAEHALGLDKSY